jgi:hypothetical protein
VKVELTGADFEKGDRVEISGSGITVEDVAIVSPTRIKLSVKLAAGIASGSREIAVVTASGRSNKLRFDVARMAR